ncbi:MAG TPA: hypothetical protein VNC50_15020 [Planctomycetia bacterium]|jgi:hypothetical protein|nr:hypothetical protein [Planctomycetia bacterium]
MVLGKTDARARRRRKFFRHAPVFWRRGVRLTGRGLDLAVKPVDESLGGIAVATLDDTPIRRGERWEVLAASLHGDPENPGQTLRRGARVTYVMVAADRTRRVGLVWDERGYL